jgi:hypothetical protein
VTGSVMALCQVPFTSLTTNGLAPFGPTYLPPALQSPGCVHDTELMNPLLPVLRARMPGHGDGVVPSTVDLVDHERLTIACSINARVVVPARAAVAR